ncbi:MAG: hypothetical protein JOZ96_02030 [Acidobacteria bacterium]|nr:hypothetical protein [Acidobacteriota bacterium]
MYLEGVVENGQIVINADVRLPDGTKVYMIIPDVELGKNVLHLRSPHLARPEQTADFEMEVIEP